MAVLLKISQLRFSRVVLNQVGVYSMESGRKSRTLSRVSPFYNIELLAL